MADSSLVSLEQVPHQREEALRMTGQIKGLKGQPEGAPASQGWGNLNIYKNNDNRD